MDEKEKAQEILKRNKKSKEKESNPQDQIAYQRFRFFNSDKYEKKVKKYYFFYFKISFENTFGLLPSKRKQELRNLLNEGKLSIKTLTPNEQKMFLGFANEQTQLGLWNPIWAFKEFIPDLDVTGKNK